MLQLVLNGTNIVLSILLGLVWGWLPCGLVYAALSLAMFSAEPVYAAGIMLSFGIGTLPMLLSIDALAEKINALRSHRLVQQGAGLVIIGFGVLMFGGLIHPPHGFENIVTGGHAHHMHG